MIEWALAITFCLEGTPRCSTYKSMLTYPNSSLCMSVGKEMLRITDFRPWRPLVLICCPKEQTRGADKCKQEIFSRRKKDEPKM